VSVFPRIAFLLAATATAGGPAGPVPTAAARYSAAPNCATAQLVVWLDTTAGHAAGSTYYTLEFTNLSPSACTLTGYPGVSAFDLRGRMIGSPAARNPAHPVRPVTLRPGAAATAVLQIVDAHNFQRAACRSTTAAGLRVYPPNQSAAKMVPFPFLACLRIGPHYLTVEAVR
jgi:Protein of unknown function (DUF4232)